jgi:hypothetical protein
MRECSQKFDAKALFRTSESGQFRRDCLFFLFIALVLLTINFRVLDAWFIIDDTANIFCSSFSTAELLFDRGTYRFVNQLYFTPLEFIAIKADWLLFKMDPMGYHIHNFLAAFLCCIIFYKVLRLFSPPIFSYLGTIILSVSLPISFDIGWITMRHYLWGFLFMLMSVYLFKRWETDKKHWLIFVSLLCSLLSFLFKEAYTFLPAVIFLVSTGPVKSRIGKFLPFILFLAIYVIWRIYMLGSLGGYPGATGKTYLSLLQKLFTMPIDISENLYGFPYVIIVATGVLAFLKLKMALCIVLAALAVNAPFVFFTSGGFQLANKALSFVAVIALCCTFILYELSLKKRRSLLILFVLLLVPLLYGSLQKIKDSEKLIVQLSSQYEKATREVLSDKNKRILIISSSAYYFSNLEDIYRTMLKEPFPSIKSISSTVVLPYIESHDFDTVIMGENFDLDPAMADEINVAVLKGKEASQFMSQNIQGEEKLSPPQVYFAPSDSQLAIRISDTREGTYLRCLHMGSYVGCYPVPREYIIKYNTIRKIDRVDMVFISPEGRASSATSYVL